MLVQNLANDLKPSQIIPKKIKVEFRNHTESKPEARLGTSHVRF